MACERDGHRGDGREAVKDVERDTDCKHPWPSPPHEEGEEVCVRKRDHREGRRSEPKVAARESGDEDDGSAGADAVAPAQVECGRVRTPFEHEAEPGDAAPEQICLGHAGERPALEMLALDRGIEDDQAAVSAEAHAELDVSDRGDLLVEATELDEVVAANRAEPRPERSRGPAGLVVDVVAEKVAEVRD